MSDQQSDVREVFETYTRAAARTQARSAGRRSSARRRPASGVDHALRYDESGFPIVRDRASLTNRIRSLLRG